MFVINSGSCYRTVMLALALFVMLASNAVTPIHASDPSLTELVKRLDHPSFQTRSAAARQLVTLGCEQDADQAASVHEALKQGLHHPSAEVRIAARHAIQKISLAHEDEQLDRLLNPRCPAATIAIPGWKQFAEIAGDDMAARNFFFVVSQQYPKSLRTLACGQDSPSLRQISAKLDPWRLPAQDSVSWGMLLLLDSGSCNHSPTQFSSRLGTALSSTAMGPHLTSNADKRVLQRLIDHWVRIQARHCAARDRLLIAMRYQCRSAAKELCGQVLSDHSAPPATQVTALLCASALGRSDLESLAAARLEDHRTAHVWQLIASRKTKIRTQVGDVAMAVLLHHHGIDPRKAGYSELQADPTMIFRDHSLGFPDEVSRQQSRNDALTLLATINGPSESE